MYRSVCTDISLEPFTMVTQKMRSEGENEREGKEGGRGKIKKMFENCGRSFFSQSMTLQMPDGQRHVTPHVLESCADTVVPRRATSNPRARRISTSTAASDARIAFSRLCHRHLRISPNHLHHRGIEHTERMVFDINRFRNPHLVRHCFEANLDPTCPTAICHRCLRRNLALQQILIDWRIVVKLSAVSNTLKRSTAHNLPTWRRNTHTYHIL